MKKAVSLTLETENVVWLRGQGGGRKRTVSAIVDQLVTDARVAGRRDPVAVRSVCGTIDLPDTDPRLEHADGYIRETFERSIRRPAAVKERRTAYRTRQRRG